MAQGADAEPGREAVLYVVIRGFQADCRGVANRAHFQEAGEPAGHREGDRRAIPAVGCGLASAPNELHPCLDITEQVSAIP